MPLVWICSSCGVGPDACQDPDHLFWLEPARLLICDQHGLKDCCECEAYPWPESTYHRSTS